MRCLPELLRRLLSLSLVLGGVWLMTWPGPQLLQVYRADFAEQFQRQRALVGGSQEPGALERFIAERTRDRTVEVSGAPWARLAESLRDGRRQLFAVSAAPFERIGPLHDFQYLQLAGGGDWLVVAKVWPQELRTDTDGRYPWRAVGLGLAILALLIYLLIPRRNAPDGLRYRSADAVILPDLLALLGTPFFGILPLLIVYHTAPAASPFSSDGGWLWLTVALWIPASLMLSMLFVGLRYSCLRIHLGEHGIRVEELTRVREFPWETVLRCRPYENPTSGRIARALLLFGGSLQAIGLAIALRGNNERGIALELADGGTLRIMTNALLGGERLVEALRGRGIAGSDALEPPAPDQKQRSSRS